MFREILTRENHANVDDNGQNDVCLLQPEADDAARYQDPHNYDHPETSPICNTKLAQRPGFSTGMSTLGTNVKGGRTGGI